ncbi:hypothetical protein RJG79_00745 [Mycoplasmatota bacterium WC44]
MGYIIFFMFLILFIPWLYFFMKENERVRKESLLSNSIDLMTGIILVVLLVYIHIAAANTYERNMDFEFVLDTMRMILPFFLLPYGLAIYLVIKGLKRFLAYKKI